MSRLRDRFSGRPDSEHEQALVRLVIVAVLGAYLVIQRHSPDVQGVWPVVATLVAAHATFALLVIAAIAARPGRSVSRRFIGMVLDLVVSALAMGQLQETGAPIYLVFLLVSFGNAFRYGRRYLVAASAMSTLFFGLVVASNSFWREHVAVSISLLAGLVALPAYVGLLLEKLTAALERAEEANRAKNRFLALMSHEMRTPLTGIMGVGELLRATRLTPQQRDFTDTIETSAHTLLGLVEALLEQAEIEAGRVAVQPVDFDLAALVGSTVGIVRPQAQSKGLVVEATVDDAAGGWVRGDPRLIGRVLLNLLGNAVKFTEHGRVSVSVSRQPGAGPISRAVRFEVADTGIGIDESQKARVFRPFGQADGAITRRYSGAGLGTAIARELVELLGGQIGFSSRPEGGTLFQFAVPLPTGTAPASPRPEAARPAAGGTAPRRGLRVLVADDYATNREVISQFLASGGYEVEMATDGRHALALLAQHHFDAAVLDLHMPELSGVEVVAALRAAHDGRLPIPVAALTADVTPEARRACEEAGIEAYVTKPIHPARLLEVVDRLVAGGEHRADAPQGMAPGAPRPRSAEPPPPPAPSEGEPPPVLDRAVYQSLIEGVDSEEFLRDVIARFFEDGLKRLADLRTGVETADTRLTREVAHALGGAAAMIGASRLAAACRRFSGITCESLVQDGRQLLADASREFSLTRREADALFAARDASRGAGGPSLPAN